MWQRRKQTPAPPMPLVCPSTSTFALPLRRCPAARLSPSSTTSFNNLRDAGVLADINAYNGALFVVYDLEDGDVCGPWSFLDLPTAQAWLTYWSQIIINRAQADGLSPSRLVAFSSVPGIVSPFARDGTTQMAAWITNSFPLPRTNTFFPQLFGPHVDANWAQNTTLRLQRFNADGIGYVYTNPNYE